MGLVNTDFDNEVLRPHLPIDNPPEVSLLTAREFHEAYIGMLTTQTAVSLDRAVVEVPSLPNPLNLYRIQPKVGRPACSVVFDSITAEQASTMVDDQVEFDERVAKYRNAGRVSQALRRLGSKYRGIRCAGSLCEGYKTPNIVVRIYPDPEISPQVIINLQSLNL